MPAAAIAPRRRGASTSTASSSTPRCSGMAWQAAKCQVIRHPASGKTTPRPLRSRLTPSASTISLLARRLLFARGQRPCRVYRRRPAMNTKRVKARAVVCALLATTAIGMGAAAYSQTMGPVWDSSQLPESRGTVKQYTLTPRGDVDGLILNDGTEVKVPKHLGAQVVFVIRPGDQVSIRGLRARAIPLIDAASITNVATGKTVID